MNWWSSYLNQLLRNSRTLFRQFSPFPLYHIFPLTRKIPLAKTGCNFSDLKISLKVIFSSSYCLTSLLPFRAKPLESSLGTCHFLLFAQKSMPIRFLSSPLHQSSTRPITHFTFTFSNVMVNSQSSSYSAYQQHRTKLIPFSKWLSVPFLPFCWFFYHSDSELSSWIHLFPATCISLIILLSSIAANTNCMQTVL